MVLIGGVERVSAPDAFGHIHGGPRSTHEGIGVSAVLRVEGDADTGFDIQSVPLDHEGLFQRL